MIQYILALLIILAVYLFYSRYLLPKQQMAHYVKQFKSQGFRVLEAPFNPLSAAYYDIIFKARTEKGDPFYHHKNQFSQVDVIVSNVLNQADIVLMNPSLIKEASSLENMVALEKVLGIYEVFYSWVKKGLVCKERDEWKHRKRILSQVFNFDFITSHVPLMVGIANNVFDQFENKQEEGKGDKPINFQEMMIEFTSSVVISGFLGVNSLKEKIKGKTVTEQVQRVSYLSMLSFQDPLILIFGEKLIKKGWRKFDREYNQATHDLNSLLRNFVLKYEENNRSDSKDRKGHKSIVELLIEEREKSKKEGDKIIDNEEIIDDIKTFVSAGADTTANMLVGLFFHVFQQPAIADKLRKEIDSVIKSDEDITIDNIKKIPYLDCIISEISRIYCSVPFTFQRKVTEDITVGGVTLTKGTLVDRSWINFFFNEDTFEKPHQFIPERWEKEESKKHQHLVSLIFSSGPRSCIGKSLAMTEMKIMMIKVMQRYQNIQELGPKPRIYDLPLSISVKNPQAVLFKRKKCD